MHPAPGDLMNVGLNLIGSIDTEGPWFPLAEDWFRRHCAGELLAARRTTDALGRSVLFLRLHPQSTGLRLIDLGHNRVQLVSETAPVGPGFHAHLCVLIKKFALAFDITMDPTEADRGVGDPTRFFETGDEVALYRAALVWFQEQVQALVVEYQDTGEMGALLLPDDLRYQCDGVATPLGPRPIKWLESVAKRPSEGTSVFPWWNIGKSPRSTLNRALALMWTEVRWRPPITDDEHALLIEISASLEQIRDSVPHHEIPWREWSEILRYLGAAGALVKEVSTNADRADAPIIGYRRQTIRKRLLGGWTIDVPGQMAEKWEDSSTWVAWDEGRSVWVSTFANRTSATPTIPEHLTLTEPTTTWGELIEYETEHLQGSAVLDQDLDEGEVVWQLQARSAVAGQLAVSTICFTSPSQRAWALETWRSLAHSSVPSEESLPEVAEQNGPSIQVLG